MFPNCLGSLACESRAILLIITLLPFSLNLITDLCLILNIALYICKKLITIIMDEQVTIGLERYNNLIGQCAKLQSLKDKGFAVEVYLHGRADIIFMVDEKAEMSELQKAFEKLEQECVEANHKVWEIAGMSVSQFKKFRKDKFPVKYLQEKLWN